MKKVIRLNESDLIRIVKRVINENETHKWVDSLRRRLNMAIDINSDKKFINSPNARVSFDGKYVHIHIEYDKFMEESPGVGYIINKIVSDVMEDFGKENGINFKFNSSNMVDYDRAKFTSDTNAFSRGGYDLYFTFEVMEE